MLAARKILQNNPAKKGKPLSGPAKAKKYAIVCSTRAPQKIRNTRIAVDGTGFVSTYSRPRMRNSGMFSKSFPCILKILMTI